MSVSSPLLPPLVLPAALVLAGGVGAAIHASGLYLPTPPRDGGGSALNVVLATLTCVFALEAAWWALPRTAPLSRGACAARCRSGVVLLLLVAVPLLAVLFAVGFRPDAAAWCVPLFLALALPARRQLRASAGAGDKAVAAQSSGSLQLLGDEEEDHEDAAAAPPRTALAECRACACPPAGTSCVRTAAWCVHSVAWCSSAAFLLLLLGGAGTIAVGWRRYPPRGTIYALPVGIDAPGARVHARCTGPAPNASVPTIWLDFGGGGHSSSDVLGLQLALNAAGRRVCVNDPPGTGWSPLFSDASRVDANAPQRTAALMDAMGEPGPFLMVGSMDGGAARIYAFALAYPGRVTGLVPMQYASAEFDGYALFHGYALDDPRVVAYARAQVASRLGLCDVIRFLGVPWGLLPLLAPPSPRFVPFEAQGECHFLNLFHEGQWDMQCRVLAAQVAHPETLVARDVWETNRTLAPHIPVLALGNFAADPCGGLDPGSDDCAIARVGQAHAEAFMRNMTTMTAGSAYANLCPAGGADVCLDWAGGGATVPEVVKRILAWSS